MICGAYGSGGKTTGRFFFYRTGPPRAVNHGLEDAYDARIPPMTKSIDPTAAAAKKHRLEDRRLPDG